MTRWSGLVLSALRWRIGSSEHGPMVAEAISTLGCNEDVAGWVEAYRQKHQHAPLLRRNSQLTEATKPSGTALLVTILARRIGSRFSVSNRKSGTGKTLSPTGCRSSFRAILVVSLTA